METVEQKKIRLLKERFKLAKQQEYSSARIGKICNMPRQEVQRIESSLNYDPFYKPYESTIGRINKAFDELGIPKI